MLRGGVIGCGFFARNHLNGWREVQGAEIVAVCDPDVSRARAYAAEWGIPGVYSDPDAMLRAETLDFVDIVTPPATHRALVELAAGRGLNVVCQKPMSPLLDDGRAMVEACRRAGVRFMVHENFRWQTPLRALKAASAEIGKLFYGRITWRTAFDVYATQPYLALDERFVLADMGVHLFDLARFFMGEVEQVYCQAQRVNPNICGEDVADTMLRMASGATCLAQISYSSRLAEESFPETLVCLEGARGSVTLDTRFRLSVVTEAGVQESVVAPHVYPWADPFIAHIQESVVRIQQHWTDCLREGREPETSGEDNLRTLELVEGAYRSAESGQVYRVGAAG
jgi:predicted dehydrogenase